MEGACTDTTTKTSPSLHPLSFVRGGYIDLWNGISRGMASNGLYWSIAASLDASYAYDQNFNRTIIHLTFDNDRALGFFVRGLV